MCVLYLWISSCSVEAATSEANHRHGHDLGVGVALVDVVVVGVGPVVVDGVVIVVVVDIGGHDGGNVEGTARKLWRFACEKCL